MSRSIAELTKALAMNAEAVCHHYLPNGRREGSYWMIGNVQGSPGRSMFVRLIGPTAGKGAAGRWTDAATGERGDLLDIIAERCGLIEFAEITAEARRFLSLPQPVPHIEANTLHAPAPTGSTMAARRLFAMAQPIAGTLAETYLRNRGISELQDSACLRFHPTCYYRPDVHLPTETWPAMIASVTDLDGRITGAHRTWLDPSVFSEAALGKAPVATPRRAIGNLLGNAVRFGIAQDVMAAGEGIETILSLKLALPTMPMVAALSAAHLAGVQFPYGLQRLYIAHDNDPAGRRAMRKLTERAHAIGIDAIPLSPHLGDFNEDLRLSDLNALRQHLRVRIAPEDADRFLPLA